MSRSIVHPRPFALAAAGLLIVASSAAAYTWPTCFGQRRTWGTNTVTFRPANISFPGSFRTAIDEVLVGWNYNTPGTRFRFNHQFTDATTYSEGDGINTVGFVDDWRWDERFIAIALWRYSCYRLTEVDVLFNNDVFWDPTVSPAALPLPGDFLFNVTVTGLHEYGHGMGLHHEDDVLATLNSIYPFGGVLGNNNSLHPHADDTAGDRAGYGTCCTERDLTASAYERTTAGRSNAIPPPATSYRGHATSFRFTISNRGTVNESGVRVQFYLSPDRWITTADTYLGAATYNLNAGFESTYWATVTIPLGLSPGSYHFGYILDPLASIPETDEVNNAVGHVRSTNVPAYSPPIACMGAYPTWGNAPLTTSFDGTCSSDPDGAVVRYQWDFGDGWSDEGPSVQHTYWSPGFYVATLTVTDDAGYTSQTSTYVEVTDSSCQPNCV